MQVQAEQQYLLNAIQSPNMQPPYGQDLNMHTYWTPTQLSLLKPVLKIKTYGQLISTVL